jgi:predicted secreted protein
LRFTGDVLSAPRGNQMQKIITRVVTIWIVLFIIFFILTEPAGAARYLHDWYSGIHSAANSLARLVNSF